MNSNAISGRSWGISLGYGTAAGAVAALTLWLMNTVQGAIWSRSESPLYIAAMILLGGVLIALIRPHTEEVSLDTQLAQAQDPIHLKKRRTLFLALSAILAVGFGGAVGPEAGLIAVVGELSAIIALKLAHSRAEERLIGETGAVAALSGLYAAPPGAALLDSDDEAAPPAQGTPLALKVAGGVAGLGGFLLVAHWLTLGGSGALPLPDMSGVKNGSEMLWAILPAVLGAVVGAVFIRLTPLLSHTLARVGNPVVQTLVGSAIFAVLTALFPLLRFSGHHELMHALEHGVHGEAAQLLALGLLKAVALSLCLASGWRGGAIFPLIFAGAAVGAACSVLWPAIPLTAAVVAGLSAASMIGLGKPVAVFILLAFLTSLQAPAALCVGVLVGYIAIKQFDLHPPGH